VDGNETTQLVAASAPGLAERRRENLAEILAVGGLTAAAKGALRDLNAGGEDAQQNRAAQDPEVVARLGRPWSVARHQFPAWEARNSPP
jgi:hypothetical protein